MNDLKKAAKEGQMDAAKIMAKDIVRTKRYVKKMIMMKTQIQAVSLKIQTLKSTNAMAKSMKGVTKVRRARPPAFCSGVFALQPSHGPPATRRSV
jgi:charged multivesicular body protein 2A